jgi:hypothetical protein
MGKQGRTEGKIQDINAHNRGSVQFLFLCEECKTQKIFKNRVIAE